MHIKNKRGQSTVEYILLVTAVVAVMIVFSTSQNTGLQNQMNSTLNSAMSDIDTETQALGRSHQLTNSASSVLPQYSVNITGNTGN